MSTLLSLKVPVPERVVQVSGSEGFTVRGLSPLQVLQLYKRHTGQLSSLFDRVMASVAERGAADAADIEPIVLSLIQEAPVIVSELIVLASGGNPDDAGIADFEEALLIASQLPFPTVADCISKIAELTFTSDMPPGKFLALATKMATKLTGALQDLPISPNGAGMSGATSAS